MDNKKSFVLDSKSLKIKEILNQDFMEIEIFAISEGVNRNKSFFTLESMEKAIPTFYNKFIMGYYRIENNRSGEGVFEEHNSDIKYDQEFDEFYWSYTAPNAEKPLGLVRESDKVEIVDREGKKWIRLTAVILTKYNREAVKHLLKTKRKRKISVEITVVKSHEKDGIEIIEDFILDAITILGNRQNSSVLSEEGIEGASMNIISSEQVLQKQKEAVCFAYKELDEGLSVNEEVDKIKMKNLENEETLINNKKEMEGITLTYEQKRDILETILRKEKCLEETDYVWVADLSENEVFFCYNGDYFRANYVIDEENIENSIIELENSNRVIRDWKDYAVENSSEEQQQEEFACGEKQSLDEDGESEQDEDDSDSHHEKDEEEEEEEKCDNCNGYSEDKDEKETEDCKSSEKDEEDYQAKYVSLMEEFEQLQAQYSALEQTTEELSNKIAQMEHEKAIAEMFTYGCEIISKEASLDQEDANALKATFKETCINEKFTEKEQVDKFMEITIPQIFYKRHKEEKINQSKEDFSMQFNTSYKNRATEETSNIDKMKNLLNIK